MPLLIGLLRQYDARRTMVFVNTKRVAEKLEGYLHRQRLQGAGAVRRRAAEEAPAFHARVPQRRARGADRHGRRLARPAHPRRQPRLQLRPAAGCARTTCIASAAPRAPAPRAMRSASAARNTRCRCRRSRTTSRTRFPCCPVKLELLAKDLKPPVYKEWDPEDGPKPMRRPGGGGGGGRGGPRRGGPGGGGRGGPPRRSGSGGGGGRGGPRRGGR